MKQIYLVDDDDDDRVLARQALESVMEDITIVDFTHGKQLIDNLKAGPSAAPEMILMDMNMPLLNGMEAMSIIKQSSQWRHIPVVLFSTSSNPESINRAYQLGVNAYIVKPNSFEGYIRMAQAVTLCYLNHHLPHWNELRINRSIVKNILIIEDNPDHAALMDACIKRDAPKLNVIYKTSHASAINFFQTLGQKAAVAIDLIVLDLYLPSRQQGLDLLAKLRSSFVEKSIPLAPIVVLSASFHPMDVMSSYSLYANAYMIKNPGPVTSFCYLIDLCSHWSDTIALPNKPGNRIA